MPPTNPPILTRVGDAVSDRKERRRIKKVYANRALPKVEKYKRKKRSGATEFKPWKGDSWRYLSQTVRGKKHRKWPQCSYTISWLGTVRLSQNSYHVVKIQVWKEVLQLFHEYDRNFANPYHIKVFANAPSRPERRKTIIKLWQTQIGPQNDRSVTKLWSMTTQNDQINDITEVTIKHLSKAHRNCHSMPERH